MDIIGKNIDLLKVSGNLAQIDPSVQIGNYIVVEDMLEQIYVIADNTTRKVISVLPRSKVLKQKQITEQDLDNYLKAEVQ